MPPIFVKVCGITTEHDALLSAEAGASALGFNFYAKSPRCIDPKTAREIVDRLPASITKVGIFVNESPANIAAIASEAHLDIVQLHGAPQGPLTEAFPELRIWRAYPAGTPLEDPEAEAFLVDTPSRTLHGGTGQTFDWALARHPGKRIVLAGGLDGSNVRAAIEAAQPWGVDACSRLESSPGHKDPRKVREYIQAALNI